MHLITDMLLVGNIDDAREPPPAIGALLLVAEEYTVKPAAWLDYGYIPFKEFAEANPISLDRAVQWLETHAPDNRTMVCCRAGMGRSVSVVIAYLCCVQGMAYTEALELVKTRRPGSLPLPKLQETIEQIRELRSIRKAWRTGPASKKPHVA